MGAAQNSQANAGADSRDTSFSFPFPRAPYSCLICYHWPSHPELRRSDSETAVFFRMFSLLLSCCWYIDGQWHVDGFWRKRRGIRLLCVIDSSLSGCCVIGRSAQRRASPPKVVLLSTFQHTRSSCGWKNTHKHSHNTHQHHVTPNVMRQNIQTMTSRTHTKHVTCLMTTSQIGFFGRHSVFFVNGQNGPTPT